MSRVNPLTDIGPSLLSVEKPARYLGGEYGSVQKEGELYTIALAFPDLYDIGMSNQAIRIIYNGLNALDELRCERVFVPAPDFERLLSERALPLYTLESGIPLGEADMLAISVGYELCGTGIITLLESSGIPRHAADRGEGDPIVMAGGPAVTNPLPFSPFLDGVWIGEAEDGFYNLCRELAALKREGKGRGEALALLARQSHVWMPGKKARRAIHALFQEEKRPFSGPVPTIKPVQDHGIVEIMRGCPNGCRFCHAGYYYRPARQKDRARIAEEVESLVRGGGYREITLSSLSSGDYGAIDALMEELDRIWGPRMISFQLPSLKVNSFTLSLLKRISSVRRSSLTFAVETPREAWQLAINKEVSRDKILEILKNAKELGWKSAKFYFMIGLPIGAGPLEEIRSIAELMGILVRETKMTFTVNVGTFVPKPHSPFQWAAQLDDSQAYEAFVQLKRLLPRSVNLSFHSPLMSELEGLISRGDERSASLFENAWERGMRLEAWEDHRNLEQWRSLMDGLDPDYRRSVLSERGLGETLPWDGITIGIAPSYLKREWERSKRGELTSACTENCTEPCGACRKNGVKFHKIIQDEKQSLDVSADHLKRDDGGEAPSSQAKPHAEPRAYAWRLLFSFSKLGKGAYYPHLSLMDIFSKAFLRVDIPMAYSQGFNPQARIEVAQALSMGIESEGEWGLVELLSPVDSGEFMTKLNQVLPEGLRITSACLFPRTVGKKDKSLTSLAGASVFALRGAFVDSIPFDKVPGAGLPNVELQISPGEILLRVSTAPSGRELQAMYPFKLAWGANMFDWPLLPKRIAVLAKAPDGSLASFEEVLSNL